MGNVDENLHLGKRVLSPWIQLLNEVSPYVKSSFNVISILENEIILVQSAFKDNMM